MVTFNTHSLAFLGVCGVWEGAQIQFQSEVSVSTFYTEVRGEVLGGFHGIKEKVFKLEDGSD